MRASSRRTSACGRVTTLNLRHGKRSRLDAPEDGGSRWRRACRYARNGIWEGVTQEALPGFSSPATARRNEATRRRQIRPRRNFTPWQSAFRAANAYAAKPFTIMEKEITAVSLLERGQKPEAVRVAKEASDIELTMSAPSGPPEPIKPAPELYGEVLLEAGMMPEAAAAFEQSLARTPNRTPSVKGLASATPKGVTSGTGR